MIIDKKLIRAYALKNALEHDGKANPGSVLSGLFNHGLSKEDVQEVMPLIQAILREVDAISILEQEREFEELKSLIGKRPEREGLAELEGVDKKKGVIMRFAPSPSGPMHLGHIFTGMLNSLYVKKYCGMFYLRIEDTNPENIDADAYEMIPEEADWIFGNVHKCYCQSDRMVKYYELAEKIIDKKSAYVCTCDSEKFKELIDNRKPCPCRNLSLKEQLLRWEKMIDKKGYGEGEAVLRFKSDLNDSNPAMRDFPLARINLTKHPRQGKKYRVWPLMNLCVACDDMEFGFTHIIRAKEHRDNAKRQAMIFKIFNEKLPRTYFLGRYNFIDLEISCSKTKAKIKEGVYSGWDDIRLPFIAALRKRGYQPEAFEKMIVQRGMSEVDKVISQRDFFKVLNNFNREVLRSKTKKADFEKTDEKKSNVIILMPDNQKIFGKTSFKPKDSEIVYFEKFGYGKFNGKDSKKLLFWFCHE
ncbi:glutamate--tRNA ligase [Candidatus Pacearchaeota archaeon]|nr:glutamate--tRNA ligase [Candidatus Pacearchaeota archaeon]